MILSNVARCSLLALSLLAAACTETTPQGLSSNVSSGSDDNGANCGGTAANKQNCINNQNRMDTDPAS
ncbi:hypothetical protein [Dongia sedimenti]|uniref:Secreted protein n=1 Tax=Dongia sedimenti TaxID=3064282 RepID=A0ABU0YUS6_9PROT|nr:hypothetical protein [Rhodospirillaceae bacterium R-7]